MELIEACIKGDRIAQQDLYKFYYSYALSVCMRYSASKDDALDILNDGFLKVFTHMSGVDSSVNFRLWIRRIMINTAIDAYRKERKRGFQLDLDSVQIETEEENIVAKLSAADLLNLVQKLPPAYRAVFNLYSIDGYTHHEISGMLKIHEGTSKSNLFKAREHLKKMLNNLEINDQKGTFF